MNLDRLTHAVLDHFNRAAEAAFGQIPPEVKIVAPPNVAMGDFAIECFALAKTFRKAPNQIAPQIAERFEKGDLIQEVTAAGPYINVKINPGELFYYACKELFTLPPFVTPPISKDSRRVMVEYLSPNTNKPLHLGHVRNGALGMAVARLYEATGCNTIKANLVNDRGVHICKSMLAWQTWGNGTTPETEGMKGDHFVGHWYVRFAKEADTNPSLEEKAQTMLQQWENGDSEIIRIWKMMNEWVYAGFAETYRRLGLAFDAFYYESQTYQHGKQAILEGLEKGILFRDQKGNTVFSLPEKSFGLNENGEPKKITLLRPDGTSLYMTQDIGTTLLKVADHHLESCIFVVGSEQNYHFQCLFTLLDALGNEWAKNCHHLSYGMVYLPEGKMKSREGKVVDADDLITSMEALAAEEVRKRDPDHELTEAEVLRRAEKIASGAIKFYLLRVKPAQDIHFDPQESISFDGFTGPYCQYAYARICGILRKAAERGFDIATQPGAMHLLGEEEELVLAHLLIRFPEAVARAARELNPSFIGNYIFNTAKSFNQFYNKHSVINAEEKELAIARLHLTAAVARMIKEGLRLLNIDVMEKM
ncbi:MAG: arginine--tRNA ligase [Desulfobacterales bacterium]|nr:arginine--tRNA ligase [Desulfobacterales bacterium]